MKRILFVLMLLIVSFYGQAQGLDSLGIIEKSKELFKKVHVDLTFKDPYSYELLKIEAFPVSLKEKIDFDISALERVRDSYDNDSTKAYSKISEAKVRLNKQEKILSKGEKLKNKDNEKYLVKYGKSIELYNEALKDVESYRFIIKKSESDIRLNREILESNKDLTKTVQWRIKLDCYGANSYGNKILGRYIFRVSNEGKLDSEFIKIN